VPALSYAELLVYVCYLLSDFYPCAVAVAVAERRFVDVDVDAPSEALEGYR
jgi:hypothetical protein